ncbi:4a-hydroxytetrahydrobiopterin dehydratase [Dermatobacter hominis]|uniref:4a-hydroxytetrahydrobiopterin dehydratase n=1 Tax=Dermatobacter hominis TaxID=2884263 RepID=UPI001D0F75C6|nr:4a-hydroxytetrahydrobiopterin dehydratase [Dermatobacter hominis]UDY35459.1 4a-hydroxytetrahydrobiopterin dehydratase [Dermatobacter hominis]
MARPQPLADDELAGALADLPGWALLDGRLHRELRFADFSRAFGYMAAVATVAQAMDHHPDWSNVYSTVVIDLVTHDVGGVTALDVELARRMSELARDCGAD